MKNQKGTYPLAWEGYLWILGDGNLSQGLGSNGLPNRCPWIGQRNQGLKIK